MQARRRAGSDTRLVSGQFLGGRRLQFVQPDARPQQVVAALGVAGMHGGHVGSRQRVGEDAHLHAAARQRRQRLGALLARNEVRRDQVECRLRPADRLYQRREKEDIGTGLRVEGLGGIVVHDRRRRPLERQAPVEDVAHHRRAAHCLQIGDRFRVGARGGEACLQRLRRLRPCHADEARRRIGGRAVPVQVELPRHLAHRRAHRRHVKVGEDHLAAHAEVFATDVAPADHRDLAVGGERLVVHAPVQAREVGQVAEHAAAALNERVVQPHLDVRVGVERGQRRIQPARVVVVEQQAHANAALGRLPQRLEQQVAGRVAAPDVVLHVERPVGCGGEQRPSRKRVARLQ